MLSRYFPFLMQIEMRDLACAFELIRSSNKEGRQLRFSHFGQMRVFWAVVAANDQKQIHLDVEQFLKRFLPLLRSATNSIKKPQILQNLDWAVAVHDRHSTS